MCKSRLCVNQELLNLADKDENFSKNIIMRDEISVLAMILKSKLICHSGQEKSYQKNKKWTGSINLK